MELSTVKTAAGAAVQAVGRALVSAGRFTWKCFSATGKFIWKCFAGAGRGTCKALKLTNRALVKAIKTTFKFIASIMDDILLTAGFVSLTIAGFKIYESAGYAVMGLCFLAYAYLVAKRPKKKDQ